MKYLVPIAGEAIVEASDMLTAKQRIAEHSFESVEIHPLLTPIPMELLYSMEPQDVEDDSENCVEEV